MQTDIKAKETSASAGLNWRSKSRRVFTPDQRLAMVRECQEPGAAVAEVARRHQVNTNQLFKWKRLHERGQLALPQTSTSLVPVKVVKRAARRPRAAVRTKTRPEVGAIEVEIAGARIFLHGVVSEANLAVVLRALARR